MQVTILVLLLVLVLSIAVMRAIDYVLGDWWADDEEESL